MGEPRAGWCGKGLAARPRSVRRLQGGIKKAGARSGPRLRGSSWRLYRLGLALGGRRSPAHDRATAQSSGSCRCVGAEIAHEHTSSCCCRNGRPAGVYEKRRMTVNARARVSGIRAPHAGPAAFWRGVGDPPVWAGDRNAVRCLCRLLSRTTIAGPRSVARPANHLSRAGASRARRRAGC
jgi:hypothetical protein